MKKVTYCFYAILLTFFLLSCTSFRDITGEAEYFIAWFNGEIVNLSDNSFTITTKDDLLEYAKNNYVIREDRIFRDTVYFNNSFLNINHQLYTNNNTKINYEDSIKIYLQPIYDGKPVIYAEYPQGVPIMLFYLSSLITYQSYINRADSWLEEPILLGKPIIMTNGFVDFATSSYKGYIILPMAPDSVGENFDIKKSSFKLGYRDENGKFRNFNKEYFEKWKSRF